MKIKIVCIGKTKLLISIGIVKRNTQTTIQSFQIEFLNKICNLFAGIVSRYAFVG